MTGGDLVDHLVGTTGLSDHAVRSVLWQLRRADWRVVRTEAFGHELVTGDRREVTRINEEWKP